MKKIVTAAAAALLLLNTGCSGFLDEELKNSLAPSNTYTNSYGFEVGVTGLYGLARSEFNTWGGAFATHGQACPYEALQVGTDLVFAGHKDGSLMPYENLSYTTSHVFVTSYWNYAYGMIASANELLTYSENESVSWTKADDKAKYQAEARYFRAYAYRYLVYLYGDVPYVDKIEEQFRLDYTRTPKAEVIAKMIEDLKFASANLPQNPDNVVPGRLTKAVADHLLAEIYLLAGNYSEAEASAKRVINSGFYSLTKERFGVATDMPGDYYSDMFVEYNQRRTNGNKEAIWIMPYEYNTTGGGGANDDWSRRAWICKYYNVDGFVLADSLGGRGLAQVVPLSWWVDGKDFFAEGDVRNSEYNIKRNWYCNDITSGKYGQKVEMTDALKENGTLTPGITKFFYGKADNLSYNGVNKDRTKMRLSETYLLLAEALWRQGKMEEAATAINMVRTRANAPTITSAQVTADFILDERIRELVGEELRRLTLVRFGMLKERTLKYNHKTQNMQDHHALWPIPQTIIDSNTGADFPQNPGY
ncbi:RagB/SusD family nutrient uptake outer membrane protein [Parabacteroides sp. 52]|uniref:RagB/SusD family nutrient uptake outer membrane protein n=1 Tax=unclassified Parabacteroides TaxID=2649774 RepID=UPI0013D89059|nr:MULTISPECIES: RagB/SusD family nutrient uptake outer membrane protein [unclassified Parabacteroides]MDH6533630.1 hypothetical protein [Parabacteroides sp. PM5-20]NDV54382.1 RagB/SusD family nutrient uptake outer membrane protein [Parabacteroides sp. 52]